MIVGAILLAISLPLAFVKFHYGPPGGSGVVDGHRIVAFNETITTWRFAHAATWSHILPFFGFVALRFVALSLDAEPASIGAGILYAIVYITFLVGCVLFVGLAVEFGHTVMPPGGREGLLPALHGSPYHVTAGDIPATPYFSSSLGWGWWTMAVGILISALTMWKKMLVALGTLAAALVVFGIVDLIFHVGIDSAIMRWIARF